MKEKRTTVMKIMKERQQNKILTNYRKTKDTLGSDDDSDDSDIFESKRKMKHYT